MAPYELLRSWFNSKKYIDAPSQEELSRMFMTFYFDILRWDFSFFMQRRAFFISQEKSLPYNGYKRASLRMTVWKEIVPRLSYTLSLEHTLA